MDTSNRTFVSSVLFLDIVEYSKQSVTDQLALKQQFNTLLVDALKHVAQADRIVLDTGDGAAISFQGNPEDSLFAAMRLRDAIEALPPAQLPDLAVRFGINLGPVRLIKDINGQINIIGDGINVAQRVMSFAEPGAILVSRSYYEVVSRLSDDYAKIFNAAGTRTDKHVREHAVYEIGQSLAGLHPAMASVGSSSSSTGSPAFHAPALGQDSTHKKLLLAAALGMVALLGAALVLLPRAENPEPQAVASAPAVAKAEATKPKAAKAAMPTAQKKPQAPPASTHAPVPTSVSAPSSTPVVAAAAKSEKKTSAKPGATGMAGAATAANAGTISVALMIKPWGEVYVDGSKKGVSPPLQSIQLTPGKHVIEIRNTYYPPDVTPLTVKPGDTPRIEHRF